MISANLLHIHLFKQALMNVFKVKNLKRHRKFLIFKLYIIAK